MSNTKKCVQCNLPEDFNGVKLDENSVCNFCGFYHQHEDVLKNDQYLEGLFVEQVEKAKQKAKEVNAKYDCIVGFSGGKDSTYIIHRLKKQYGMRVLAYTFDNGFCSDYGNDSIRNSLVSLDVDYIRMSMRESALRSCYDFCVKILRNFCAACFHYIHYYGYMLADQNKIPLIVNGRTRGQIYQAFESTEGIEPFALSTNLKAFEQQMFGDMAAKFEKLGIFEYLPEAEVTALSYFAYHDVSEDETMAYLEREIGWKRPLVKHQDCWAHDIAEVMSLEKRGHPIRLGELAYEVRAGKLSKEEMETMLQQDRERYSHVDEELQKRFNDRIKVN